MLVEIFSSSTVFDWDKLKALLHLQLLSTAFLFGLVATSGSASAQDQQQVIHLSDGLRYTSDLRISNSATCPFGEVTVEVLARSRPGGDSESEQRIIRFEVGSLLLPDATEEQLEDFFRGRTISYIQLSDCGTETSPRIRMFTQVSSLDPDGDSEFYSIFMDRQGLVVR